MSFNGTLLGLSRMTHGLGHVLHQTCASSQTTVSSTEPLARPSHSHVPTTQSYVNYNVSARSADHSVLGHGLIDHTSQGGPWCHPAPCMGYVSPPSLTLPCQTSGEFPVANSSPPGHTTESTEVPTPVRHLPGRSSRKCGWISEDQSICGQKITGRTVPKHLAGHGIRNMHKDHTVQCCWLGCGVKLKRQGIARHAREVHLGLKRNSFKNAFALEPPGH